MAQPVSGSFEYDLAAYIRKIVNGIKCNSCVQLAQPGGQSSQTSLRHLPCGHLACIKCIDKECTDCSAIITHLDIHFLDFLKTLQKFIEKCVIDPEVGQSDNNDRKGSDDPTQVVQEQVQNSVESSIGTETPPCDSSHNDQKSNPNFKKPPRPKKTSASKKTPSKAKSRTNLKPSAAPPPPSVSAVSPASSLRVSPRKRKPKVHELVTCHSTKENSATKVSKADSSSSIVSTKRQFKKIKFSDTEEEVPKSELSCTASTRNSSLNGRNIGIVGSGLDIKQKLLLTKFKDTFPNVKVYDDYDDEVTHVIGHVYKRTRVTVCSLTYMKGLLGNKWLMSIDWIKSSIKEKKILSEEAFELKGTIWQKSTDDGVPMRARLAMVKPTGKLFNGMTFHFDRNICRYLRFDEVKQLVELGGGKVVNVKPDQSSNDHVLVIVDDEEKLDMVTVYKKITADMFFSFIENYTIDDSVYR